MPNVFRLVPKATTLAPMREVEWIFSMIQREKPLSSITFARNWYVKFVQDTGAGYEELRSDPRFFVGKYWETDALIRFTAWLNKQQTSLSSKSRYSVYKTVRYAMDWTYQLGITDHIVYHAPMFKGLPETDTRAPYSEQEQEIINVALGRCIQHAMNVIEPYRRSNAGIRCRPRNTDPLFIDGESFTPKEASLLFGVRAAAIASRNRKGWTHRQCVNLDPAPQNQKYWSGKAINVEGVEWSSLTQAAEHYGVARETIGGRLDMGCSPEQAVGLTPIYSKAGSFECALYEFEERFECDPLRMLQFSKMHRGSYSSAFLMKFFVKIGVWPYVDQRLILPIAAELCRITGLNAESVASLTLDSYIAKHPLTNRPCIRYTKPRSGSANRTDNRELHVALLEDAEYFVEDAKQTQVAQLIELAIKLTQRIRDRAEGETKNRLFIYEHNGWFRSADDNKSGVTHIIWGYPSLTERQSNPALSGSDRWYKAFCKENGLYEILGKDFTFNISRFRSTLINNMVKEGANIFTIQAVAGHESISTTANYLNERALDAEFIKVVKPALESISEQTHNTQPAPRMPIRSTGYTETLCGTGCKDAFNPSETVRKLTNHIEGSPCKFWNMCLLCEQAIITEDGLPKIIAYKWKIEEVLLQDKKNMEGRKALYGEILTVIETLITPGQHYPETVLKEAEFLASELDDEALDHLVYQGL
ncbi:hypothetical protein KEHDKFFH_17000 [Marinobacter maroccanus]|uniref:Uncharacterized protein n=1 Tax=Marinobacter maroccanus TaxID=2055143 RepID=A0A2S5Z6W1_9GAMM|nr:site-specific integrase [Marinobacter maroccanus]PPI82984.1 hypothetical protein KEHDKFFH_17000 [Marinobacter maroccanus]